MNKKRKLGIGFKITSGYIILIVCLVVAALVLNNQITSLQTERNSIIKYDSQMRMMSNNLERKVVNMESSLHRYLITDDETHLNKYNEELASWQTSYDELSGIVNDFSSGQQQLELVHSGIEDWINNFGQPLKDAILTNNSEQINSVFNGVESSVAISDLQQKFTAFRTFETEAIQAKVSELNDQNTALTYSLFAILTFIATVTIDRKSVV